EKMQMKYNTAQRFWRAYIRMANGGKAHVNMPNPAIDFTARAYAGDFDEMSDSDYAGRLEDTEALTSFWDGSRQEAAGNVLLNAIERTELSDYVIEKIAGILADASVRTDYCAEEDKDSFQPGLGFPPAYGMKDPASSPHEIYGYLNKNIYGQEAAKRAVSMLMYHHLHGNSRNIVMAGASGCGKTEIFRTLSKKYDFIRIINGPQLSCDGWKGSFHLKDIFWDEPKETAEHLVIVVDEADKMLEPAIASGGTDVARRVQNELLKLMDGDTLTFVSDNNNDKSRKITVDCSGVSVVLCGSFETMLQTKAEASSGGIGFLQSGKKESRISECSEEDLVQFGNVRREIAGRISQIVTLDALTATDFEAIMESEMSPIR
ncbi:MAG: AAA family ATPase, partial [Lachnospiraceae bacterium]|nr:AAA family ATPase [Lachnospiraceae bacterium]